MKKMLVLIGLLAMVTVMVGCASVQTAQKFNDQKIETTDNQAVAHVNGDTWGLYFLWIPLFTGSVEKQGSINFMIDDVKLEQVVDMVTKKSKEMGASRCTDLQSSVSSSLIIPPFLIFLKEVQVSGNAVK